MWKISKSFEVCYGHRVHCQLLNEQYSAGQKGKCRFLHGHNANIVVTLESETLNERGMVCDFLELNWFKKFIDEALDHKFVIDKNDPMFNVIVPFRYNRNEFVVPWLKKPEGYEIVDPNFFKTLEHESLVEILEGFVVVDFVPTSENLSKWLFDIVKAKMDKININTNSVQFYETPKSQSVYQGE